MSIGGRFEHGCGDLNSVKSYESSDQLIQYHFSKNSLAHGVDSE